MKKTGSDTGGEEGAELVMFILSIVIYRYAEYIYYIINFPDPSGKADWILKKLEFYFMPESHPST